MRRIASQVFFCMFFLHLKKEKTGNSLVIQWLGLRAFTAEGVGSTPGWELSSCKPRSMAPQNTNKQKNI